MPPTKNWKRTDHRGIAEWFNKETLSRLTVRSALEEGVFGSQTSDYIVELNNIKISGAEFDTKTEAMNFARNYIKGNPEA